MELEESLCSYCVFQFDVLICGFVPISPWALFSDPFSLYLYFWLCITSISRFADSYPSITVGVVSISYPFHTHSPGLRIIRIISTLSLICIYLIWRVLIYDSSVSSISVGLFFRNLISSTYVISPLTNHFPPISLVLNLYPFLVDKLSVSLLYL